MKCGKVIAQRKFAQGVCVPHSQVQVERKQSQNEKLENIHHVKTSASNLLDLITYNGIHQHLLHPVVYLEKMQDTAIHSNGISNESVKKENTPSIKSPTVLSDDDVPLMFLASEKKTVVAEVSVKMQPPANLKQNNEKKPQIKRSRSSEEQPKIQFIGTKRSSRSSGLNTLHPPTSPAKKRKSTMVDKTLTPVRKKGTPRRSGRKRHPPEVFASNLARNKNNLKDKLATKINITEPLKKKVSEKEVKEKSDATSAKKCAIVRNTLREISSRVSTEPELYSPNEIERWIEDGLTSQRSPSVDHEFKTPVVPDRPPAGNTRLHTSKGHQELPVCISEQRLTIKETLQREVDVSCNSLTPLSRVSVTPEHVITPKKTDNPCKRRLNYIKTNHSSSGKSPERCSTLNDVVQEEPEKVNIKQPEKGNKKETEKGNKKEVEKVTKKGMEKVNKKEPQKVTKKETEKLTNKKETEKFMKTETEEVMKTETEKVMKTETEKVMKTETEKVTKKETEKMNKKEPEEVNKNEPEDIKKKESEKINKKESEKMNKKEPEKMNKNELEKLTKKETEKVNKQEPEKINKRDLEKINKKDLEKINKKDVEKVNKKEPEKVYKNRQLNKKRENNKSPVKTKDNDVYIFSDDSEQSVENHGLSDFRRRQSDSASTQNEETEDALINILGPDNSKIVLATFAKASKMKKLLRAKLVDKSDSRYRDLPVIERNFLEDLVNIIKLPNSNNSSQSPNLIQVTDSAVGSSSQKKVSAAQVTLPTVAHESKLNLIDAPVFKPTVKEFSDPIAYIEKIATEAVKYGLCKVVPPEDFAPPCLLDEEISFNVSNQNIARMYSRWGRGMREMSAFKVCAAKQGVQFTRPPLIEGFEVNLPKLFHLVQDYGGLNGVLEKKRWGRIAEQMHLPKAEKKLDLIYVKYLLPFETMSQSERQKILSQIDKRWDLKSKAMMDRANNPFHRQKRLQGESDSSDDETDDGISFALKEAEDCVTLGRRMNVATYQKVATHVNEHLTPNQEPSEVENQYWKYVLLGNDHICVHSASIDTGEQSYGFPKNQKSTYGKHPWNMKMISLNNGNMLRFLGPVIGVTVPTLHLGMTFSTSCWHRDPHGLPWIEYMHSGPSKIWYGIPEQQSEKFRKAVETLCPAFCQNKAIWLPSDIAMIPPKILQEHNICLSRLEQNPGEFVIVFPKAYSCSVCTGYTISESVYFATNLWLSTIHQVFQEVQNSCEPTMFSLEQLLLGAVRDTRTPIAVLQQVTKLLSDIVGTELTNRKELARMGVTIQAAPPTKKRPLWADINNENSNECEFCRRTLYLSKVTGLTNNRSALCLHHAIILLETDKYKTENLRLQLEELYSDSSLTELLKSANTRLAL